VVATPRSCYRLPWLRGLFPRARVQVVHLVRNPAASINGLRDGWRHSGFFNVAMPEPLAIRGYTDPGRPWTTRWWKFDVPPGWSRFTHATLEAVCAEQWASAHEAVLGDLPEGRRPDDVLRVRYEDLVGGASARTATAHALARWLDLARPDLLRTAVLEGLDPQMATAAGGPSRWRRHATELLPVLRDDRILALAERLGYGGDPARWP
jgi:hypothetical protein